MFAGGGRAEVEEVGHYGLLGFVDLVTDEKHKPGVGLAHLGVHTARCGDGLIRGAHCRRHVAKPANRDDPYQGSEDLVLGTIGPGLPIAEDRE